MGRVAQPLPAARAVILGACRADAIMAVQGAGARFRRARGDHCRGAGAEPRAGRRFATLGRGRRFATLGRGRRFATLGRGRRQAPQGGPVGPARRSRRPGARRPRCPAARSLAGTRRQRRDTPTPGNQACSPPASRLPAPRANRLPPPPASRMSLGRGSRMSLGRGDRVSLAGGRSGRRPSLPGRAPLRAARHSLPWSAARAPASGAGRPGLGLTANLSPKAEE